MLSILMIRRLLNYVLYFSLGGFKMVILTLKILCHHSFFRTLEDVISRNRKSVRLLSYPLHIMNYTSKLVLTLLVVYYCMDLLALAKQCLPRLLLITPLLPSSGLWDLNLCRSILVRYVF